MKSISPWGRPSGRASHKWRSLTKDLGWSKSGGGPDERQTLKLAEPQRTCTHPCWKRWRGEKNSREDWVKGIDSWRGPSNMMQQLKAKPMQSGGQTAKWQREKLNKRSVRKAKGAACWE